MSETSPPTPIIVVELKGRRRLTSVKRASEPYDATLGKNVSESSRSSTGERRVSGTEVICGDHNAVFEFNCKD